MSRKYLIFDHGTHSSRFLEKGWSQNKAGEEGPEGSGEDQVSSSESWLRILPSSCKELMLHPSWRPRALPCQELPAHLLPALVGHLHLTSTLPPSGRKSPRLKRKQVQLDQTTESARFPRNKQLVPFSSSPDTGKVHGRDGWTGFRFLKC